MKSKATVIDNDGTWWKVKCQYKKQRETSSWKQKIWKRSEDAGYESITLK